MTSFISASAAARFRIRLLALPLLTASGCSHQPPPTVAPNPQPSATNTATPSSPPPAATAIAVPGSSAATSPSSSQAAMRGGATGLHQRIDSLLSDPRFHNAFWGVLVVNEATGDTIYARNPDKLFLPASNMKVITSAVALTQLGSDFRFRTVIAARGRVEDGRLIGDLAVIGRGDPTMSDHMEHDAMISMRAIADSLAARGIHHITGHLVSGGDAFPDPNVGYGWDWDDLGQPYGAGVDELMFNEGFTTLTLHAGRRPGSAVRITSAPVADYPIVQSRVTTIRPGGGALLAEPTATFDAARGRLLIDGSMAPGDTLSLQVAYPDPATAYLYALAGAVRERGIDIRKHAVMSPTDMPPAVAVSAASNQHPAVEHFDTLFTIVSPPLRDVLPALLKPSQNQIAEILLKTLGLERTGVGSADSGRRVVESQLAAWDVPPDEYVIHDGSGLSRHDYLSPGTLVRVLSTITHDTAFSAFYNALPIAGVDGTIGDRMRGTPAAGNVHAKTGFVDRARSLSGYATSADGQRVVFSMLCNNWTVPVHDVEQVQDAIATLLASSTVRTH